LYQISQIGKRSLIIKTSLIIKSSLIIKTTSSQWNSYIKFICI